MNAECLGHARPHPPHSNRSRLQPACPGGLPAIHRTGGAFSAGAQSPDGDKPDACAHTEQRDTVSPHCLPPQGRGVKGCRLSAMEPQHEGGETEQGKKHAALVTASPTHTHTRHPGTYVHPHSDTQTPPRCSRRHTHITVTATRIHAETHASRTRTRSRGLPHSHESCITDTQTNAHVTLKATRPHPQG